MDWHENGIKINPHKRETDDSSSIDIIQETNQLKTDVIWIAIIERVQIIIIFFSFVSGLEQHILDGRFLRCGLSFHSLCRLDCLFLNTAGSVNRETRYTINNKCSPVALLVTESMKHGPYFEKKAFNNRFKHRNKQIKSIKKYKRMRNKQTNKKW